jgi:sarcosine oxidase subunit alpha
MSQYRLPQGGIVNRDAPLSFQFNGKTLSGFAGDTLASALLANGQHLIGRSFKYHRPRGIIGQGAEDPNALVQLGEGSRTIPNVRATQTELYSGLVANSVNCWPSVDFDVMAVNQYASRLLPAGFYYKTFKWPAKAWHFYEERIRASAGLGTIPNEPDPDRYEHVHKHAEVMVVGAGAAGLAAALAASRAGAQILLVDDQAELGGGLLAEQRQINSMSAYDWAKSVEAELRDNPKVQILTRSTAIGYYDHNFLTVVERRHDHLSESDREGVRERLWKVRAREVVLAQGAFERPMIYGYNDLPGTLLAGAVETYINRYAVKPGNKAVLFTNNDNAYSSAMAMLSAGMEVQVVDSRADAEHPLIAQATAQGADVLKGYVVTKAKGGKHVKEAVIQQLTPDGRGVVQDKQQQEVDLIAVSGGWNPAVHLHSHTGGKNRWDDEKLCFVPDSSPQRQVSVGSCNGSFDLYESINEGFAGGLSAAQKLNSTATAELGFIPAAESETADMRVSAMWLVPQNTTPERSPKAFVDYQNDTSAADIRLAVREGFHSVEHVKRYTAMGFGTDQGKMGNINGMAILAEALGQSIPETGTTTFRPLYTPTSMGAMAGSNLDDLFDPIRKTPMHAWHTSMGATWEDVGQWKRAWYYPDASEDMHAATKRESTIIHSNVAVLDASTLGKIDIQGPDAAEFLNRVYINGFKLLKPGRCRYGIMLNDAGFIMDDGVTTCLGENHYLMTTTTGGAAAVLNHLELWLQTEWPELKVYLTSVTDHWATISVNGPDSRKIVESLCSDVDFDSEAFPFMSFQDGTVAGAPCRIMRISFSGELTYEINVPAHMARHVWSAVFKAGEAYQITPYGTETMHIVRAEKGFIIVGQETDGSMTAHDVGYGGMFSSKKEFIGKRSAQRVHLKSPERKQLVGMKPVDGKTVAMEGAHILTNAADVALLTSLPLKEPIKMDGHITSSYYSPVMGHPIALAVVKGGQQRHGEKVMVSDHLGNVCEMEICATTFYDLEGAKQR